MNMRHMRVSELLVFVSLTARTGKAGFALRFSFRRAKPTWAVAGEKVMVLETLLFEIKQSPSHCKGGGFFSCGGGNSEGSRMSSAW